MQQQHQPSITTPRTPQSSQHQTPSQHQPSERELPMLAGIGAFVTWCEDLLAVLSGPILTAGLAIALIDLLSDGQLFTRLPMLLWVWAGSMALGLDAQFIGSSAKLARAMRQRRPWVAFGYILLCLALGYVAFLATYVFAVQEANGISTTEALSRLGMDSTTWIFQRSVLAVILVFLSGLLRYVPPAVNVAADTTEERERLLAEIELEPLRAQKRAMQLRGMRGAVLAGLGREQPAPSSQTMKPHIVAASYTAPEPQPHLHRETVTNNMMHDYDIPDETEEEDDPYGYKTGAFDTSDFYDGGPSGSITSNTKRPARTTKDSRPKTSDQRSKIVAKGHKTRRDEEQRSHKRLIRDVAFNILDARRDQGMTLDEVLADAYAHPVKFADEIQERAQLSMRPSAGTARRQINPWYASRSHRKTDRSESVEPEVEIEPLEPQELRELVATEAW